MDQNTTQVIDRQGVRKLYPEGGTTTLFKSIRKKPENIGKLFKILSFIISYLLTSLSNNITFKLFTLSQFLVGKILILSLSLFNTFK